MKFAYTVMAAAALACTANAINLRVNQATNDNDYDYNIDNPVTDDSS